MAKQSPKARVLLREALSTALVYIEMAKPSVQTQHWGSILNDALAGIDDLDHGEIPEIFTPSKTKRRVAKPAQVRHLQLLAIVHVEALRRRGLSAKAAKEAVAKEYFIESGTIKSWQIKAKDESIDEYKLALGTAASLDRTQVKLFKRKLSSVDYLLQSTRKNGRALDDLQRGKATKVTAGLLHTRG